MGVSAPVVASATAFAALKLAGGLYLLHLGVQAWRSAGDPPFAAGPSARAGAWPARRQGALVEAANPKTAAFLLAPIPRFVDPARGVAARFAVLGLVSVALNTGVAALVVGAASALRGRVARRAHLLRRVRQGTGGVLGGLGLPLPRRPA